MAVDSAGVQPVLDIEGTLARFGGDKQLFIEMSGIVLEDAPRVIADLRLAVAKKDAAAVRAHAHAIKGLTASCGGVRVAAIAQTLEDAGQASDLGDSHALLESLIQEFDDLARAVQQYCARLV